MATLNPLLSHISSFRLCFFFFFQAEDGIRDYKVTGVQTCALPISVVALRRPGVDHPVHHRLPDLRAMETAHKRPNYILIWVYLAVLTAAELALAFELPISRNLKLLLLLFLAVWKAALVGLFFMHLKFERWNLRIMALIPVPLALIFILAGMSEHIW